MNLIRNEEVEPIEKSGLTIVWCPLAYMSRGTPMRERTRIPEMKARGVPVALGTDSARQSSSGDAGFLALHLAGEAGYAMVSEDVIEMQTIWGARAAGLAEIIGSIESGKRADIVLRAHALAELAPSVDPVHQLICAGHGSTADTVLVNGRIVLRNGRSTLVDESAIFASARASAQRMAARLKLNRPGFWPSVN
jgi:cytosine/adenosine deaminase-related metal-dependent hydrolase